MDAVGVLLSRNEKILIYPEQAMWWNYRKPRPLKDGAFRLAAKNNAPIIPFFLTMRDSERIGADGFPIQAYTVHILPPIYPDPEKTVRENTEIMKNRNFELWKEVYESTYGIPLSYD
jgi:1-acyl-sn-glycerol-3-phosphate acyltransferase